MPDETFSQVPEKTEVIPYAEFKLLRLTHPSHRKFYRLKQPLPVMIEKEKDLIICSLANLRIYGCGDTMDAALRELEHILVTVYESYSSAPKEELTQDAEDFLLELADLLEILQ
ncbi:MAG: hypothetical protein ACE1ZS_10905 [Candidatus Poribacteria bacterium]